MIIDRKKLSYEMARCGKDYSELNIPLTTIRNVRQGREVRPKTVYKFAQALGCSVDDILIPEGCEANDNADTN